MVLGDTLNPVPVTLTLTDLVRLTPLTNSVWVAGVPVWTMPMSMVVPAEGEMSAGSVLSLPVHATVLLLPQMCSASSGWSI